MDGTKQARLSPMDNVMPRIYARLIFCFRRSPTRDPLEIHRLLDEGLRRAATDIPSLASRVFQTAGQGLGQGSLEWRAHADWTPTLVFRNLSDTLDYDDLMDDGLPQDELDRDILFPAEGPADWESGVPVFLTQANFLEGGLLLSIAIYHPTIDGTSAMVMMKKWAEHTRQLQGMRVGGEGTTVHLTSDSVDPGVLMKLWRDENNNEEIVLREQAPRKDESVWRLIGLTQPSDNPSVPEMPPPPPPVRTTIFYVSKNAFGDLHAQTAAQGDPTSKTSANDALMALLWRAIIRARFPDAVKPEIDTETILDTTFDGRGMFSSSLPWSYIGTLIFINTARMGLSTLTSPDTSLGLIARTIREATEQITTPRLHEAFAAAAALPNYNTLGYPFATFAGAEVCITSWIALGLFDISFGDILENGGRPELARPPRREFDAVCRRCVVLPLQPAGGFEVLVSLVDEEIARLETDAEFRRYATVVSSTGV
ncbi:transferase family-domain-containing protein [Aspergillus cavernicola]|uniref:Transferase family-domain-containing protein n=1 Tax=Aspergillus cavernicola TaxID=176166 RepID=A0ABR4INX6_9EURO